MSPTGPQPQGAHRLSHEGAAKQTHQRWLLTHAKEGQGGGMQEGRGSLLGTGSIKEGFQKEGAPSES